MHVLQQLRILLAIIVNLLCRFWGWLFGLYYMYPCDVSYPFTFNASTLSFLLVSLHRTFYLIRYYSRSPSTSRIRAKMLYSTSKDRIKYELDGFHYEIQATDPSEVDIEVLRERAHWSWFSFWRDLWRAVNLQPDANSIVNDEAPAVVFVNKFL